MTDLDRLRTHARTIVEGEAAEIDPVASLVAALERSMLAIDDWLNTYAADLCDQKRIDEAAKRICQYGTLSYIASVQDQNRAALSTIRKHQAGE